MNSRPTVSVIMPVYNCAAYVREAVESILNQTLTALELIIIDDCSTDGTAGIIAEFDDERIVFIRKTEKTGLVASLNMSIERARGIYLARMDGDDISKRRRLEKQVLFMEQHPDIDLCGTAYQLIGQEAVVYFPLAHEEIKMHLMDFSPIAHPTVIWRKDFFDQHQLRYLPEFEAAEDYELWTRVIWLGKMANMADSLLWYRQHSQQFSHTRKNKQVKNSERCRVIMLQKILPSAAPEDPFTRAFLFEEAALTGIDELNQILSRMSSLATLNAQKNSYDQKSFVQYVFQKKRRITRRFFASKMTHCPKMLRHLAGAPRQYLPYFSLFEYLKLLLKCLAGHRRKGKKQIVIAKLFDFGGANAHLKMLIRYLGAEQVVLVLASENERKLVKNITDPEKITVKVIPWLHDYAHLRYRFSTNIKELGKILRAISWLKRLSLSCGNAAIHICSSEPEKYLYLLWTPFARVLYTLHSTPGRQLTPFTAYTCNHTLSGRKQLITVSRANRELLCDSWNIDPQKAQFVKVIANCLPGEPEKISVKPKAKKIVLTLGHVIDYKNPGTWLQVALKITSVRDDVVFKWLGDGPLYKEFEAATRDLTGIDFEGYRADCDPYFRESSVYYQPSIYETQGIAVIEAMSYHLPCVVSDTGGLPESVIHAFNGLLVPPSDVEVQRSALLTLLDQPNLRDKYGQNGYRRYRERFTYDIFKQKLDQVYGTGSLRDHLLL
jgi:glycosyltransferase involved in cell wall biosynthesis